MTKRGQQILINMLVFLIDLLIIFMFESLGYNAIFSGLSAIWAGMLLSRLQFTLSWKMEEENEAKSRLEYGVSLANHVLLLAADWIVLVSFYEKYDHIYPDHHFLWVLLAFVIAVYRIGFAFYSFAKER